MTNYRMALTGDAQQEMERVSEDKLNTHHSRLSDRNKRYRHSNRDLPTLEDPQFQK